MDENIINSSFNIQSYRINGIVTSITSNKFKESMKNGYYLFNKNNISKLIEVSNGNIIEKSIDKFKVYIKNNVYKPNNEFYIVVNNKLYNIKQVKQIILNKMLDNENLSYFKNSSEESFNNGIYFIQDLLNVKKQYKI